MANIPKSLDERIKLALIAYVMFTAVGVFFIARSFSTNKDLICTDDSTSVLASCNENAGLMDIYAELLAFALIGLIFFLLLLAAITIVFRVVITGAFGKSASFKFYYNIMLWVGLGFMFLGFLF